MIDFQKFREFSSCKFESEHTKQNERTAMVRPDLVTDNQAIPKRLEFMRTSASWMHVVNDADRQYLSRAVVNDVINSIHPFFT